MVADTRRLDTGLVVGYDFPDVFSFHCIGFDNICDMFNDSGEKKGMKKLLELFKKIRKRMPPPSIAHRDKSKYTRKNKFKQNENNV
jgi:hypothetical protein